ncbi:MAG: threonine/serine exporter family protein [Clostridiales bacterium]|nr:threonine/serine exporter family protein [Clostridiales bacterium]
MTRQEQETLVEYTLNIGRQMMECGAEAWRAENTMARIFRAYGLEVLDAHVMATQAAVTVKNAAGEHYTSTCMILPDKTGTDLERLEILNAAARHICEQPPPLDCLPLSVNRRAARWSWRELLGYVLGAGAFAVFFGGGFLDGLASGFIGGLIYLMEQVRRVHHQNRAIYTSVACFLSGLLAQGCVGLGFGSDLARIMIGDIMLFIPGLVIVNGVREFFYADILTGVYRLIEALLIAGAIAAGYAVALMLGGKFG